MSCSSARPCRFFGKYALDLLDSTAHKAAARKAVAASAVLLQNVGDVLPLQARDNLLTRTVPDSSKFCRCFPRRVEPRAGAGSNATLEVIRVRAARLLLLQKGLKKVAVVGPWSDCKERGGGYGGSMGYLNNYKGQPSYINTILDAVQEEARSALCQLNALF